MIEEAALRDARRLYQFLDRGRAETLVQHRLLGDVHDPLARPPALVRVAADLYRGCSFFNRLVHTAGSPSSKSQNIHIFLSALGLSIATSTAPLIAVAIPCP